MEKALVSLVPTVAASKLVTQYFAFTCPEFQSMQETAGSLSGHVPPMSWSCPTYLVTSLTRRQGRAALFAYRESGSCQNARVCLSAHLQRKRTTVNPLPPPLSLACHSANQPLPYQPSQATVPLQPNKTNPNHRIAASSTYLYSRSANVPNPYANTAPAAFHPTVFLLIPMPAPCCRLGSPPAVAWSCQSGHLSGNATPPQSFSCPVQSHQSLKNGMYLQNAMTSSEEQPSA